MKQVIDIVMISVLAIALTLMLVQLTVDVESLKGEKNTVAILTQKLATMQMTLNDLNTRFILAHGIITRNSADIENLAKATTYLAEASTNNSRSIVKLAGLLAVERKSGIWDLSGDANKRIEIKPIPIPNGTGGSGETRK